MFHIVTAKSSKMHPVAFRQQLNTYLHPRNFFEMIFPAEYCILYSDKENVRKTAATVAQLVERGKTGLDKDLNSNPNHLSSALSRVRIPSW